MEGGEDCADKFADRTDAQKIETCAAGQDGASCGCPTGCDYVPYPATTKCDKNPCDIDLEIDLLNKEGDDTSKCCVYDGSGVGEYWWVLPLAVLLLIGMVRMIGRILGGGGDTAPTPATGAADDV